MSAPPDQCLIIAAGRGSRLAGRAESKPLLPVAGVPLLERAILSAKAAGVGRFVIVTGYLGERVERFAVEAGERHDVAVVTVRNPDWERENGLSVLAARGAIGSAPFFLTMADHLVDPGIYRLLARVPPGPGEVVLAVDGRIEGHPMVDLDDVTRVHTAAGLILAIGKGIAPHNAFDTGVFAATSGLFDALAASAAAGETTLSGGMRILAAGGKAKVADVGGLFWLDVDDEAAFAKAERHLTRPAGGSSAS